MKILVTGGAGFIGSNIVEALIDEHDVSVLDNFFLGRKENLSQVLDSVELIEGNILDEGLLKKVTNVDIVFHEAAVSSSPMFMKDLKKGVSVNVIGFVNVLNACKENNVRKLIFASTSSIYGNNPIPLSEDQRVIPPNFYAVTKLAMEHLAEVFYKTYSLPYIGFRYMSVYGPHEEAKNVYANLVSQFLWKMKKDEPPEIYGDGEQRRDFTYVKDVVQANLLAIKKGQGVYNVGSGRSHSLNELVDILNKILGKNIKPKYMENPIKGYIYNQLGDLTKVSKDLGYKPKYDLETGIRDML